MDVTTCKKEDIIESLKSDDKKVKEPEYIDVSTIPVKQEKPDEDCDGAAPESLSFISCGTEGTDSVVKDERHRESVAPNVKEEVIDEEEADYGNTEQHKLEECWNEEVEKNSSVQSGNNSEISYDHFLYDAMKKKKKVCDSEKHEVRDTKPCSMCGETVDCQCHVEQSEESDSDVDQDLQNKGTQDDDKKKYLCDVCSIAFSTPRNLKQHKYIHSDDKSLQCDICKKGFSYAKQLSRHKLTHNTDKKYQCDICNKVFYVMEYLKRHKLIIHNDDKLYQCDICSKVLPHSDSLRKHRLIHRNVKPYQCDICTKFFSTAGILKRHKLIHSDLKMYKCGVCNKGFNDPQSLRRHTLTHKNNSK